MAKEKTTEDRIRSVLMAELGVDEGEVTLTANVMTDLGADSLDCAEIAIALEDEFEIDEIDVEDIERMPLVSDLVKFFEKVEKRGYTPRCNNDHEDDGN